MSTRILIIGKSKMHADLVAALLGSHLPVTTTHVLPNEIPETTSDDSIVLVDMGSITHDECCTLVPHLKNKARVVLINLPTHEQPEVLVALPGIRGILTQNDNSENLTRAIKAVLDGEYWLPRHILWHHLENTRKVLSPRNDLPKLSKKEIELLSLLLHGHSNDAIANALLISPHTVKTHFYNLFRKLNVRNRVQAATWARDNLPQTSAVR